MYTAFTSTKDSKGDYLDTAILGQGTYDECAVKVLAHLVHMYDWLLDHNEPAAADVIRDGWLKAKTQQPFSMLAFGYWVGIVQGLGVDATAEVDRLRRGGDDDAREG